MKTDEIKKLSDDALTGLNQALQAGRSDSLKNYLQFMARFHKYSFGNIMLIALQHHNATHVAGFNSWKKFGRFVKKGEKGIAIIAPVLIKPDAKSTADSADDEQPILRFKVAHVFDISQTEGDPVPELATISGDPGIHLQQLKTVTTDFGIELTYEDLPLGTFGFSSGGTITLASGRTPAEEFSTLAHELAHELLHRNVDERPSSKTVRETEAESVAFVVSSAIGLEADIASQDYIQLYHGDAAILSESLERIQKTASKILTALFGDSVL